MQNKQHSALDLNDSYNDKANSYKGNPFDNDTHSSIGSDLIRDIKRGGSPERK